MRSLFLFLKLRRGFRALNATCVTHNSDIINSSFREWVNQMKQAYVPTRQNQPIEVLFFPQDVFAFMFVIIAIFATLGFPNLGVVLAIYWITKANSVKDKGRGFIFHYLWNKGWLPTFFAKGVNDPLVKEYIR